MNRYKMRKEIPSGQAGRTSENLGVVVAQGKGAHCHDLRDGTEPEDLGISESLEIPEALGRVPTRTISACRLQTFRHHPHCHTDDRNQQQELHGFKVCPVK